VSARRQAFATAQRPFREAPCGSAAIPNEPLYIVLLLIMACSLSRAFSVSPARARESNTSTSAFH